jgi:hypothetical protein
MTDVDTNSILYKIGEAVKAADAGTFEDFNSAFGSTSPLADFDFKLQSLTDIDLEAPNTPEDGEVLAYNATEEKWVATAVAGGTGEDGDSAYEVWLRSNSGTEQDFLESLEGADGADGIEGPVGPTGPEGPRGLAAPYFSGQSALGKNPAILAKTALSPSAGFYADLPDAIIANYTNNTNLSFEGVFRLHWILPRSGASDWEVLYRVEATSVDYHFAFKLDTDGKFCSSGVMLNGALGANTGKVRTEHHGKNLKWFIENDRAIYMHGNNGGGGGSDPMSVVTTATRVDGSTIGELAYESDTDSLLIWNGTSWRTIRTADVPLPPTEISATTAYSQLKSPSHTVATHDFSEDLIGPSNAVATPQI